MNVVSAQSLTKHYGHRIGIELVDLDIAEGELFGFLGPNGAGKTTTIRLLLGFLRPTRGVASVFGADCWRDSAHIKADVGYLPGDLRLYPWMTGGSALTTIGGIRGRDLTRPGERLAERFGLDLTVRVQQLSRGMRQKLGLILAFAHAPRLVILDEPTTGLDPLVQMQLVEYLRELAQQGHTVFFSSHTLSEVEQLCTRIAVVREGRIVADETLASLRSRARRQVTLVFRDAQTAQQLEVPAFLQLRERSGPQWNCELTGSTKQLIGWSAQEPVEDITIGQPDLESLFRRFYQHAKDS